MSVDKIFEARINKFLNSDPDSDASKTIKLIKSSSPDFWGGYLVLFEELAEFMGLRFNMVEYKRVRNKRLYVPFFRYKKGNLFGKEEERIKLIDERAPITLDECYEGIAKELLYRFMAVKNLEEVLEKFKNR